MLGGASVLLVEDDPLVAETMRAMIEEGEGSVAAAAESTSAARQLLKAGTRFDVALLDVNLGDGTVTPLLESLRSREVPTVVYTGGDLPASLSSRHPELRVLRKPVVKARLVGELRRAMGR